MANVTLNVTDAKGQATGTVEAPEALFGVSAEDVQAHIPLIHQVVTAQLAAARQGTHATKTRGMVSGGGKKPWKQKGTGRARQGSIRAPQWYHGGTVFGPQPRDYSQRTPKKMKAAALRYALSDRANAGRVAVVEFGITEPSPLWPRLPRTSSPRSSSLATTSTSGSPCATSRPFTRFSSISSTRTT